MAVKIIEFHNQQYFVGEYYFAEFFDSIVTVSHDGNAVLKATPDASIILGSVDVTPNELENRELLSRRLSTLPVKDRKEDAFAKFETSYIRADDKAEPTFVDSEVFLLPVSDDYIIELDSELLAKFNYLTVDNTKDQAVRLHKGLPAFDGARWDSFTEQLKLENLDGNFKGDCTKSYSFESLIRKAKKQVIVQKRDCGMFYMGRPVKDFLTVTQRYNVGAASKEDIKPTAKDVFVAFERIKAKEGLIYTIIKSVIDVFRRDEKLLVTEVEDEGTGYAVIEWNLNADNSGDVEIRYENFEDYVSDESWVELTFWLNALCVRFKILDDYSKVEGAIGNTETFVPMLSFDANQLHQDYKDFALFVAKALPKISGLND
jgi:hypothetical protein|nr:MAG TPA: hypothetical protein [Caudoviricetes sp.]